MWLNNVRAVTGAGDTMSVLNADDLDLCTALWAVTVYSVASLDTLLPRDQSPVTSAALPVMSHPAMLLAAAAILCAAVAKLRE